MTHTTETRTETKKRADFRERPGAPVVMGNSSLMKKERVTGSLRVVTESVSRYLRDLSKPKLAALFILGNSAYIGIVVTLSGLNPGSLSRMTCGDSCPGFALILAGGFSSGLVALKVHGMWGTREVNIIAGAMLMLLIATTVLWTGSVDLGPFTVVYCIVLVAFFTVGAVLARSRTSLRR